MEIRECIEKYYTKLSCTCRNLDQVIYDSKTCEDILNECIITAINKYDGITASEEELYEYVKKTFLMEMKFSFKRRGAEKLVFTDNMAVFEKREI